MKARISRGGQVSIPAAVRRRWATDRVVIEDQGNALVMRPLPADPIDAARGSIHLPRGMTVDRLRRLARAEDEEAEAVRSLRT